MRRFAPVLSPQFSVLSFSAEVERMCESQEVARNGESGEALGERRRPACRFRRPAGNTASSRESLGNTRLATPDVCGEPPQTTGGSPVLPTPPHTDFRHHFCELSTEH